jgi:diguanylate cyclase (GGDEF)-like protein/PAS domain S-box-containing protein
MTSIADDERILIVDDDTLTRTLAAEALREAGYVVTEAESGEAGLVAFEAERPALVLLDVVMPGLHGFEVCRQMRAHPRLGHVPVIMLTGLEDTESIELAYDSGATDFISKPINWTLLRYRVGYTLRTATVLEELIRSERNLSAAQQIAHMGSWEWSLDDQRIHHTRSYYQIFGEDAQTFGEGPDAVLSRIYPPDRPMLEEALGGATRGRGYHLEYRIVRPDGFVRTVSEAAVVVNDPHGKPVSVQGTLQDVTERVEAEKRIRYLAFYDDLTGLPNRTCFREMVQAALLRAGRRAGRCAVVLLDVVRFGRVAHSLGQESGDQALQLIAARLREFQRSVFDPYARSAADPETPRVARLGGDEFALLVEDAPEAGELEPQVHRLLTAFKRPFKVAGEELSLTARAGFALGPEHASDGESLLKAGETALAEARRVGHGTSVMMFSETMKIAAFARISLESALRRAIVDHELRLFFQPKVDARTHRMVGAEALLRWMHPERGVVSPGDFVPLAEESGLIAPLSEWVLDQALAAVARWQAAGLTVVPVSVNVCAAQFRSERLAADVGAALLRHRVAGEHLEIEVTESVLMQDVELATRLLAELATLGVRAAIDDFGTGYSSLAYLKQFRLDTLKIDRSFVAELGSEPGDAAIVGAVIALARNLRIGVVAEGVEDPLQAHVLLERGCPVMQGYLFSRPLTEEEFIEVLRSGRTFVADYPRAFDPGL